MPFILEEHTSWVDTPRNSWKEMLIFKENTSRDYLPWDLDQSLPISMTSLAPSFPIPTACHPPMLIPHHLPTISHRPNSLNRHHQMGHPPCIRLEFLRLWLEVWRVPVLPVSCLETIYISQLSMGSFFSDPIISQTYFSKSWFPSHLSGTCMSQMCFKTSYLETSVSAPCPPWHAFHLISM